MQIPTDKPLCNVVDWFQLKAGTHDGVLPVSFLSQAYLTFIGKALGYTRSASGWGKHELVLRGQTLAGKPKQICLRTSIDSDRAIASQRPGFRVGEAWLTCEAINKFFLAAFSHFLTAT